MPTINSLPILLAMVKALQIEGMDGTRILSLRCPPCASQSSARCGPIASFSSETSGSASGYLTGPSDALAAAQLQDRVKSVVETAGGELRSNRILPATPLEGDLGFRRATLRVRFVVTIEGLETTLYELETGQPYLIIYGATVRQERVRRRRDESEKEPVPDVASSCSVTSASNRPELRSTATYLLARRYKEASNDLRGAYTGRRSGDSHQEGR